MKTNTFELEQKIMNCWCITDDLDIVAQYASRDQLSTEEIVVLLNGLKRLYHMKFDDLFTEYARHV